MKGKIEVVTTKEWKGKTLYSMKVNGEYYGCGAKSPGQQGDYVEFDVEENGKYKNAGNIRKVEGAPSAPSGAPVASGQSNYSTDKAADREYKEKNDQRIGWQAARNSANALLATAVSAGFQDAPDTFSKLVAASNKLTQDFFNSTLNLSNGGGNEAKAKASKPAPSDDEGPEDQLPF